MVRLARKIFQAVIVLLPWQLKRRILETFFGYRLHPTASIGLSWVYPKELVMNSHSRIGHFCVAINLERMTLMEFATISRSNWITGFGLGSGIAKHFAHRVDRMPQLVLGRHSAITKNHHIDCTDTIEIGEFTTIAGYNSQFLTHSIDLRESRQDCRPIKIGDYCFVGTNVLVFGGARLPSRSVLGAGALLINAFDEEFTVYAGVPAKPVAKIPDTARYFTRDMGFVV